MATVEDADGYDEGDDHDHDEAADDDDDDDGTNDERLR